MAGDHKCPVCQATFTRPQHVARHMRSHTGDRPYKCQHCGDQFARSDLLSRHVNKCHAGDKPPTTTAPTRRKGQHGASTTRATTSKQACDQCVVATLPCDGANPCSKCIQRKSPCTYVKFQRQTAPSGPGHRHNNSYDSALASVVPRPDELFLGPPPMTVPSMGQVIPGSTELYYPNQGPFAFQAPPGAPIWDSDSPNPPPSLSLSVSSYSTDSGHDSSSPDLNGRYRVSSFPGQTGYSGDFLGGGNQNVDIYALQQRAHAQPGAGLNDAWQMPNEYRLPNYQQRKIDDGFAQYLPSSSLAGTSSSLPNAFDPNPGGLYNLGNNMHARRGSVGEYSDHSNSNSSAPNSAASSSIHLPLDGFSDQSQSPADMLFPYDDGQPHPPPSREGSRVANSFGLMSLGEHQQQQAAAAGSDQPFLANVNFGDFNVNGAQDGSGAPFFSSSAMKMPPQDSTPRPFLNMGGTLGLNSPRGERDRESDMRDLRDFWKQYLRTPLTGPSLGQTPKAELLNSQIANGMADYGLGASFAGASGSSGAAALGLGRPTPKRGLSRVASLPSVRTPSNEQFSYLTQRARDAYNGVEPPDAGSAAYVGISAPGLSQSQSTANLPHIQNSNSAGPGVPADDLKSYQQAILARKPLNLNFTMPPRKSRNGSTSSSVSPQPAPQTIAGAGRAPFAGISMNNLTGPFDSGSSSEESGLKGANASYCSSATATSSANARPGFKRLASQTLERGAQKRTQFRFAGVGEDGDDDEGIEERDSEMESESEAGGDEGRMRMRMPLPPHAFSGSTSSESPSPAMDFIDSGARQSSGPGGGALSPGSYHRGLAMAISGSLASVSQQSVNSAVDGRVGKDDTVQNGVAGETLVERFRRQSVPASGAVKPLIKLNGGVESPIIQG